MGKARKLRREKERRSLDIWSVLTNWYTVSVVVPAVFFIGLGVLTMSPPEFKIAYICFALSAILLAARIGYWLIFEQIQRGIQPFIFAFLILGLIGSLWVVSMRWVAEREHKQLQEESHRPYKIGIRSTIVSDHPGNLTLFMAGYGNIASPVFYLINLSILNLQNTASTIEGYSVAVGDSANGPWQELIPISLLSTNLYALGINNPNQKSIGFPRGVYRLGTAMTQKDLTHAILLDPSPKLENELKEAIGASKTMGGWTAFDLRDHTIRKIRDFMRVTIRDSTGKSFSEVVTIPRTQSRRSEIDAQVGLINVVGPIIDMTSFHVRYYSDPVKAP